MVALWTKTNVYFYPKCTHDKGQPQGLPLHYIQMIHFTLIPCLVSPPNTHFVALLTKINVYFYPKCTHNRGQPQGLPLHHIQMIHFALRRQGFHTLHNTHRLDTNGTDAHKQVNDVFFIVGKAVRIKMSGNRSI